jgi:predicted PurR-regulated permease PerM
VFFGVGIGVEEQAVQSNQAGRQNPSDGEAAVEPPGQPAPSASAGNPLSNPQEQPVAAEALDNTAVVPLRTDKQEVPVTIGGPPTLAPLALQLSPHERLVLRELVRYLLLGGVIYFVVSLMWSNIQSLIPFIVGLALAYIALPMVDWLNQRMPRWAAILTVYLVTSVVVVGAVAYIVPPLVGQVRDLITNLPTVGALEELGNRYFARFRSYIPANLQQPLDEAVARALSTLQNNIAEYASRVGNFALDTVLRVLDTVIFIIGFLVIPFWLFYVIIDGVFSKYIRGQLILGVIVGTFSGLGLFLLNMLGFEVNYILVLAIFAGVTELIPVIGPIIGAVPAIILGLFDGPTTALAVLALYVVIQQVENQVLVPRITGEAVGIHPAVMFVLLAVASQAYGLLGAILAAPVAAALRDMVVYLNRRLSSPAAEVITQAPPDVQASAAPPQAVSPPPAAPNTVPAPPGSGRAAGNEG